MCCVVALSVEAWRVVMCREALCDEVSCGKMDVVKWRVVPSRGVTRSDGNLERVEIRAVNAPIVAHCDLVAARFVTAAADCLNHGVGEEGIDERFHGCCFWVSGE